MGFFFFALRNVKKILINPPKSFHDWKMKFFYIHEEVIPIAMIFFVNMVLVTVGMSEKWPERNKDVPVLLFNGEGKSRFTRVHSKLLVGVGVRPLRADEEFWYKQIKPNFMFVTTEMKNFANYPEKTEGARIITCY
ncbi:hypothetical protein Hanom_Chr09g00801171 [Helianthus anomalus]